MVKLSFPTKNTLDKLYLIHIHWYIIMAKSAVAPSGKARPAEKKVELKKDKAVPKKKNWVSTRFRKLS